MGLGDALYLQSVVRHLVEKGQSLEVCTAWPDVFRPLAGRIRLAQFTRERIDIIAHYTLRKGVAGTSQFTDMCLRAGITEPVDLKLDWIAVNPVPKESKPLVLVQLPRTPMGRVDGFGAELLPDCRVIQKIIDAIRDRVWLVQVGSGEPLFRFSGIHLDLAGKTSVSDLLDLASVADGFLGYCSFLVPLAESFSKPALFVWSRKGLVAPHSFIRQVRPEKVLHRATSRHVIDNCSQQDILEAAGEFLDAVTGSGKVQG